MVVCHLSAHAVLFVWVTQIFIREVCGAGRLFCLFVFAILSWYSLIFGSRVKFPALCVPLIFILNIFLIVDFFVFALSFLSIKRNRSMYHAVFLFSFFRF